MRLPRWGTLLTYGSALVMRTLRFPGMGSTGGGLDLFSEPIVVVVRDEAGEEAWKRGVKKRDGRELQCKSSGAVELL